MNQIYQHNASALDFKDGIEHTGCFKTYKEAQEFIERKKDDGCLEPTIHCKMGVSPWDTTTR